MLVILVGDQIVPSQKICQTCLLADQTGQPRWHQGQLRCGHALRKLTEAQPDQYECQMGFRVADIQ
ncbi:MAG: hypothetical protein HC780_12970 [Leptolyngbyaceae cyanobacterium CSU_1_3]|nr:hypothetical protein [Leptolyngbyaceae cyanobacterium CSU_1_3]